VQSERQQDLHFDGIAETRNIGLDLEVVPPLYKHRFKRWRCSKRRRERFLDLDGLVDPQGAIDSTLAQEELKWFVSVQRRQSTQRYTEAPRSINRFEIR
jgi:hypothetical protein